MKTIISLLVALLISLALVACKKEQQTATPAPAENAAVATEEQAAATEEQAAATEEQAVATEEQAATRETASDEQK
ncbi:MAG: hypothetical protein PWP34_1103 [Desulfuromonadales bacterium]|nr:hypothetical protein [Desulfuromonadales bacterium]